MYSFDVYDTLITRRTYTPEGIFMLMSYIMFSHPEEYDIPLVYAVDFAEIRKNAERIARLNSQKEIGIDDIYINIKKTHNLDDRLIHRIEELELQCELENSVYIAENIRIVREMAEKGEHIVLISDMYMPKDFYQKLFEKVCPDLNKFPLYISCEEGVSKSSGLLYELISKREKVVYSDWIHFGDNNVSDVNIPRLLGIHAKLYKRKSDNEARRRIESAYDDVHPLVRQFLFGAVEMMNAYSSEAYRVGFSAIGIILYSYIKWVIEYSKSNGIRKLGFIARDGYILRQIADRIIAENGYDISTVYLYGSRKAWRVKDKDNSQHVREYVFQEFDNVLDDVALVDTQGTGISIHYLSEICNHRFTVLYYMLRENPMDKNIDAFTYTTQYGESVIEAICRAPHGATSGYERKDRKICPILEDFILSAVKKSDMCEFFHGINDFVREMIVLERIIPGGIPIRKAADGMFRYCCDSADRQMADVLGNMPHDTDNENDTKSYAPKLDKCDIRRIEYERTNQAIEDVYDGEDLNMSYKRLSIQERGYVEQCKKEYFSQQIDRDKNCKKIIIYGYGKYGQELYHRIFGCRNANVICIVDINSERYSGDLVDVSAPDVINKMEYDYIVISLLDTKKCDEIKKLLLLSGVQKEKIIYRDKCIELLS
ncbi:hypothetical protein SAMN06296386_11036 [Lachnospiraceae bacterium]|nr:hypothetical protein SAMN06296386_11036 [Lachnospiraceae bacterium]